MTERAKAENEKARLLRDKEALPAIEPPEKREAQLATLREAAKRAAAELAAVEALPVDPAAPTAVAGSRVMRARLEKAAAAEALAAAEADSVRAAAAAAFNLPQLRRSLLDKKIAAATAQAAAASAVLEERAAARARELAAEAERAAAAAVADEALPDALRPLAEEVSALRTTFEAQNNKRGGADRLIDDTDRRLKALRLKADRITDFVETVGLTDDASAYLREERPGLPDVAVLSAAIEARRDELAAANLAKVKHRRDLAALPREAEEGERARVLLLDAGLTGAADERAEARARELLRLRRTFLEQLVGSTDGAADAAADGIDQKVAASLLRLQQVQEEFRDAAEALAAYIDERVLWTRSGPPLNGDQLRAELPRLAGWAGPGSVRAGVRSAAAAVAGAATKPPLWLAVLACVPLLAVRLRLRGLSKRLADPCRRKGSRTFRPTAAMLGVTLAAAAAGPAVLAAAAAVLRAGPRPAGGGPVHSVPEVLTAPALAAGLAAAAAVWLPLAVLRAATRRDGLAEVHFEWPPGAVRRIHRVVRWFTPPLALTALAAGLLGSADPRHAGGGWERVAFAAACGLTAWLFYRLFRPNGVLWEGVKRAAPESPSYRLRTPLCLAAVLGALGLGALSLAGYHYTAGELAKRAVETVGLLVGVVLLRSTAVRWVTVSRRSLLYAGMLRRREEAAAREKAATAATAADAASVPEVPAASEPGPDAAELSVQTRKLVTATALTLGAVGLWFVWADVLPALNKLEDVTFPSWTVSRVAEAPPDGAAPDAPPRLESVPLSLWDVLIAAAAIAATILAFRNLPGLLELSLFDRLPLDAGGRYALTRLANYAVVVVGILYSAGRLGFEWENVQWLVAALSVGLGFGLQEIVANFVCGAIILFERPVRVGDIVTVDDVTGVVSRIRIRATTITNWDRKEFIVPNKEFVTGRLLNWTLSDNTNRIVVEVGVAYGSDTRKALELLLEVCREEPLILSDPAPLATFEKFGDSTLNLTLRCFLPNLEKRLPVVSGLHGAIDRKFREHGIEIAFPQRDLHVRTLPAGLVGLSEPAAAGGGDTSGGAPRTGIHLEGESRRAA